MPISPDRNRSKGSPAKKRAGAGAGKRKRGRSPGYVMYFGKLGVQGTGSMKELLGGKGANLAEMTSIGLPVPPGFTISTEACRAYSEHKQALPSGLMAEVRTNIAKLEKELGKAFGSADDPLLVSVRSGAAVSMPGMMDTVLNLGLTDATVQALAAKTGNPRFALDAYRRLINMFGNVAMGVRHERFERAFDRIKKKHGAALDTDLDHHGMREVCEAYKRVYREHTGEPFPQDPKKQLELAIRAVFDSWETPRAASYRRINGIRGLVGTAVNVQSMVYGNMGDDSGTGVAFTRNPSTGKNELYGEFLVNAQGEDVVAGIRTPRPISEMRAWNRAVYEQFLDIRKTLEAHYRDMQDIEFTVERGTLYMLQTRTGKRTGPAGVKIACDMVREGVIDEREALLRVPAGDLTQLLLPTFTEESKRGADIITTGLPASPGAAVGQLAFSAEDAVERAREGESVILVRRETSPEDIEGMHSAVGILTSTGGMTSHAAVVARGWGKCCVAGAGALYIDEKKQTVRIGDRILKRTDTISIDGSTGEVMLGEVPCPEPKPSKDFKTLMKWADGVRTLRVRTNADTPGDAARARAFGAEGIGLCRTEHMFFEGDRILAMRRMILSETRDEREEALKELLPYQRKDFEGIFRAMKGLPVTIRLLDPPLHEFVPSEDRALRELAKELGLRASVVKRRVQQLHEMNPMLGHRGCRLAVTYPEILVMQVRAIVEAAILCSKKKIKAIPEIMVPLVGTRRELEVLREQIEETIASVKVRKKFTGKLDILIGTMIEVPRAALRAGEIAEVADFFSFGTNDLTQLTYGYSRDDAGVFLSEYLVKDILPFDPFQRIDAEGVGELVEMGTLRGRAARPGLKVGICGEHGGDPASVEFCHRIGLDYVSCSPFRVPIARLAAAQAALRDASEA